MVAHAYHLSSWELGAGGSRIQDNSQPHKKFETGPSLHETFFFFPASKKANKISLAYASLGSNTGNNDEHQ